MRAALSAVRDSTAVVALPVPHGLHLKSACSAVDSETLLLADNAAGHAVEAALRERAPALAEGLRMVYVCDALASNVLRIGGAVVAQGSETALGALRTLCDERGLVLRTLPRLTEFEKADGALTCLSVLLP
jgi:dimethylargininase